jgi:hypothetical protein
VAVVSTQHEEAYRNGHYRASDDLLDAADEFISIESIRSEIERDWYGPATGRMYSSGLAGAGHGEPTPHASRAPEGVSEQGPPPVVSPAAAAAAAAARFGGAAAADPGPGSPLTAEEDGEPDGGL